MECVQSQKAFGVGQRKEGSLPLAYTSKFAKAGVAISDTKIILYEWNPDRSIDENFERICLYNLLGKASRSQAKDVLSLFRQRYLSKENIAPALSTLVKSQFTCRCVDKILYFHLTRADSILGNVVANVLVPRWSRGITDVSVQTIKIALQQWVKEGVILSHWGDSTVSSVARGIFLTLCEFGIIQGKSEKYISPVCLPVPAFAYIAFYLERHRQSGVNLCDLADWELFFLDRDMVERFFFEAHQCGFLEYYVAGSVTRLSFPAGTLEEYARILAESSR